jgi:RNA polymerase sigma factor (sigma-70 family)
MSSSLETGSLLERWHAGDQTALAALIQQNLDWIRAHVRRRLGPSVRRRAESQDFVQDTLIELLHHGPRFVVSDQQQFRALMARLIENAIRRGVDFHTAQRRDLHREAPLPSRETVLALDPDRRPSARPSEAAAREETRAMVALALELLDPQDRFVIVRREYQGQSFAEIAAELNATEDAARMRFQRALPRLARKLVQLRGGRLEDALAGGGG